MAERDIDVACLGILVADVYGRPIDEWPQRGRLSLVEEMTIGIGGCAANVGIDLAKLGAKTAVVGRVGDDGFGTFVRQTLESAGVDTSAIRIDPEVGTSGTMVMVHGDGERSFLHYPGANARVQPEDMPDSLLRRSKIVLLAGALVMPGFDGEPAASVLRRAQEAGATTCLDTVWDATGRWMDLLGPMLPYADIFLPSIAEAAELVGETEPQRIAERLMAWGPKIVGLKQGEQGCYLRTAEEEIDLPAFDIQPVDGTGAGDAFVAGFLRGYLEGWSLEEACRLGCAAGAMATLAVGTTTGVGSMADTLAFIEKTPLRP
ncbi:MAG: carbohydrate kinase family protein [Candidatus Zipacnadales bacterium]